MKAYKIDFKDVKTYMGFYQTIIKSMEFPSWCGENPSAIWDMLTTDIETPAIIYINGINELPQDLQGIKKDILDVFSDTCDWYEKLGLHVEIKIID